MSFMWCTVHKQWRPSARRLAISIQSFLITVTGSVSVRLPLKSIKQGSGNATTLAHRGRQHRHKMKVPVAAWNKKKKWKIKNANLMVVLEEQSGNHQSLWIDMLVVIQRIMTAIKIYPPETLDIFRKIHGNIFKITEIF